MFEPFENQKENLNGNGVLNNLMYLAIGTGIGAFVALLFAPKSGKELRSDIADAANETLYSTVESASHLRQKTADYYEEGKDIGQQVLGVVSVGASEIGAEVRRDVKQIANIVGAHRRDGSRFVL